MARIIVCCALQGARTYNPLLQALAGYGAEKLIETLWLVEYKGVAMQLRDILKGYLDHNDALVVIEVMPGASWSLLMASVEGTKWLRSHIR